MNKNYDWKEIKALLLQLRELADSKGYYFEGRLWSAPGGDLLGIVGLEWRGINEDYVTIFMKKGE